MNVGVLYSGGKDSTFALYWATLQGWNVTCLITIRSKNPDSYMFHTPNIDLVQLQSEALGIPVIFVDTIGDKEKELEDLSIAFEQACQQYHIQGVVTGAVASNYQEERINRIACPLGLKVYSPLWHKNQEQLVEEMIASGFCIKIVAIAADGLTPDILGKDLDFELFTHFKKLHRTIGFHVAGEGGEYESFVTDCPLFNQKIEILNAEIIVAGTQTGRYHVREARLFPKKDL